MAKKKSPDLFGDDDVQRPVSEFEALLNARGNQSQRLKTGDRLRGEVLAVTASEAFVSTGTPTDAVMPLGSGIPTPKTGDMIDVIVLRAREDEIIVKSATAVGVTSEMDSLEDAFDMELPVEGVVLEEVKGGFRVKIQGQKGFCPVSQIDWRCVDPKSYVGRSFSFIITKYEAGRDLVVSRRKVLELERAASEGEFLQSAQPGDLFTGTIFRLEKYGAFIRLENGIEGLIPTRELSWGRIHHPQEVVATGQMVEAKLLSANEEEGRLKVTFSMKQSGAIADPWSTIESDFPRGTQMEGTVESKEPFGLFVNIAPGLTGLLPRSAWRDSVEGSQYENKRKGDKVKVRVDRIDNDNRKLSFSLPGEDADESWRQHTASSNSKSFGTLGDLLKGIKPK